MVDPWYESLNNSSKFQQCVLFDLIKQYEKTQHGINRRVHEVHGIEDFRKKFPTIDYRALSPYLEGVKFALGIASKIVS